MREDPRQVRIQLHKYNFGLITLMRLLTTSCNHRVLIPSLSSAYFSARFHVLPPLPRLGTNLYKCSLDLLHILVIYRLPHQRHLPGCCYGTCQHGHRGAHLVIGKLYLLGLFHLIQLVSVLCCSKCHVSLSLLPQKSTLLNKNQACTRSGKRSGASSLS